MSEIVTSVPFALVKAFVEVLGAEARDVASVRIEPYEIEIVCYRRDDQGRMTATTAGRVTQTTVIKIDNEKDPK